MPLKQMHPWCGILFLSSSRLTSLDIGTIPFWTWFERAVASPSKDPVVWWSHKCPSPSSSKRHAATPKRKVRQSMAKGAVPFQQDV